jgi:hypothetical protein
MPVFSRTVSQRLDGHRGVQGEMSAEPNPSVAVGELSSGFGVRLVAEEFPLIPNLDFLGWEDLALDDGSQETARC